MADNKRGGRSSEDEFDENDALDELDDADDADDAADDDFDGDLDEAEATSPSARKARAARSGKTAKKRAGSDLTIVGRFVKFIREVVAELQKVIYPTRKELLTYTSVVLVFVVVVMTVVSLLDVGFAKLMFLVFGNKTSS